LRVEEKLSEPARKKNLPPTSRGFFPQSDVEAEFILGKLFEAPAVL
jgi:hypothetical protein